MEKNKFSLTINGIFCITGKGIVVTGRILEGHIRQGDKLTLTAPDKTMSTRCTLLEKFCKVVTEAEAGEYVSIRLSDIKRSDIQTGMRLVSDE